jgi:hypothetical protein
MEVGAVAVPRRIPVRFEDIFPHGAFVLGVEASNDYERVKAGASDTQERDKDTGERPGTRRIAKRCAGWRTVKVLDADPEARSSEVKIKITAPVQPVPPEPVAGTPFRPVEFDGLTVIPWVDTNGQRPRLAFAMRASGMRPVATVPAAGRRSGPAVAA